MTTDSSWIAELPFFDWRSAEYKANPLHILRMKASASWIARTETGYAVFDRESARLILNQDFPISTYHLPSSMSPFLAQRTAQSLSCRYGLEHVRLRTIVTRVLRRYTVRELRPHIRSTFQALFEKMAMQDRCDLVSDLFNPFPALVMASMLSIPDDDVAMVAEWAASSSKWTNVLGNLSQIASIEQAWRNMEDYLRELLAQKRRSMSDDLLSDLIHEMREWSEDEVVAVVAGLFRAGLDTTRRQLACTMYALLRHPDQWRVLVETAGFTENVVEEGLRYAPMIHILAREATIDFDYNGVRVHPGEVISVMVLSANRDVSFWPDPDDFNILRSHIQHYTFGAGRHSCLGAPLARMLMSEAIRLLTERVMHWSLLAEVPFSPVSEGQIPLSLPVAFSLAR